MEITEIPIAALREVALFDVSIVQHGFEPHNRDYYFIVYSGSKMAMNSFKSLKQEGYFKIIFTHCFDMNYRHKFANMNDRDLLRQSWDDSLISPHIVEKSLDSKWYLSEQKGGYWWGQGFSNAYPGFSYDPDSSKAKEMSEITAKPMYAILLDAQHYVINLIFHDFRYEFLGDEWPECRGCKCKSQS